MKNLPINTNFSGSILDFGCALGDAIPIYSKTFPNAKLSGYDISETAVAICRTRYGNLADFYGRDTLKDITPINVIIASHVMEHLTDDRLIVAELLDRCNDLFVFVPYMENPLYIEHVNYYDENYYNGLPVVKKTRFIVEFDVPIPLIIYLKSFLKLKFKLKNKFSKQIIMFQFRNENSYGL